MPASYPISFPSNLGMSGFSIGLRVAVARTESPFSFVEQVVRFSGEVWEIEVSLPPMFREDAEAFNSFLLKLRGKFGTFLIGDPNATAPRGTWSGTPVVDGASQVGDELSLKGFDADDADAIKEGDYIQIGTGSNAKLYKALEDVGSDGTGTLTVLIAPSLRTSPADESAVITTNAQGVFRLRENLSPVKINDNSLYSINFTAVESLRVGSVSSGLVDPDGDYLVEPA